MNFRLLLIVLLNVLISEIDAQNDSLVLNNGNLIKGELKGMRQDVATFKTDYSDSDFKIKWSEIKTLNTTTEFLVTLKNGNRYNGALKSNADGDIAISTVSGEVLTTTNLNAIVLLVVVKSDFWSKLDASVSVGYNFIKSDNQSQFSLRSALSYNAKRWSLSSNYNQIRTSRDEVFSVRRMDAGLVYKYYMKKNWFTLSEVSLFRNTEQNIDLRTLAKLGMGKYILRSNKMYWAVQSGVSYNNESFMVSGSDGNNNSGEGFLGTELNIYNIGDLTLLTRVVAYPSFTEKGRFRVDSRFDLKYDLPLNFYINFGITLNHDNQPVQTTNKTDYVLQSTIGWDL